MKREFDFDSSLDRRHGDSHKWNKYAKVGADVIPAWVADMDFQVPPAVVEAVGKRLQGPALGYSEPPRELVTVILDRLERLYGWCVHPTWMVALPGVVPGLYATVRACGDADSAVIVPNPSYHHFLEAPEFSQRQLLPLDSKIANGRWQIDFEQLEVLAKQGASSFMLCNPHNPLGRILEREELQRVAEICLQHQIVICSDEIHADLLLDEGKSHIPIATLSPEIEQQTITLVSPSKSFNLPGIGGFALAIIPNPEIRKAFERQIHGLTVHPGALAYEAALAAYRDSEDWLRSLLVYLRANRDYLQARIAAIPGLSMTPVEATFLAWINVADLGLDNPLSYFLAHGVALSDGSVMGDPDYLRINFACTRATLKQLMDRIESAVSILSQRYQYTGGINMSNTTADRKQAVTNAMQTVRKLSKEGSPSREELDLIETQLAVLIAKPELFSEQHYPNPPSESPGHVYLIAEDEGHQNSLYLVCANGKAQVPPHDHKTWAAIGGLSGEEENTLYNRVADAAEVSDKLTIKAGDTLSLMPEEVHSIRAVGGPTRHLHWYGKGFSEQTGKIAWVNGAWIEVPADMIPIDESRRVL